MLTLIQFVRDFFCSCTKNNLVLKIDNFYSGVIIYYYLLTLHRERKKSRYNTKKEKETKVMKKKLHLFI